MKVYEIVAVKDNLVENFMQPTFVGTLAEAQRLFEYQINSIELWKNNASDYELWSLGKYDAETGAITSELHKMINGSAVIRKEKYRDIQSVESSEA